MTDIQDQTQAARAAGYTDDEIRTYLNARGDIQKGIDAGYTREEVERYIGLEPRKDVPQAFVDRIQDWRNKRDVLDRISDAATKAAKEGFGEGPLGFEPGGETEKFFEKHFFTEGGPGPIRLFNEAIMRPAASAADAIARISKAAAYGVGGGVGQLAEEFGQSQGMADRLKRDVGEGLNIAAMFTGHPDFHITRFSRDAFGKPIDQKIGALPEPSDFQASARAITGGDINAHVVAKLEQLWQEKGIHPAEVFDDAKRDPTVKQAMLSIGDNLPVRYGGGGGKEPPAPPEPVGAPGEEPRRSDLKDAEKAILARISVGEGERKSSGDIYTATVDKLFPIKSRVGDELHPAEDPYALARMYAGVAGKAEVALRREGPFAFGTYENVGPSLEKILDPVKGEMESFRAYATARRAAELENIRGVDTGIPMDAAEQVVRAAPQRFHDAFGKLVDYQNQIAAYLRDSGVLSRRGYEAMIEANRHYVPLHRIMDDEGLGISPVGASLQPKNPVQRIKGSERVVIDPLESVIKNTYLMMAMSERNVVGTKLVDMLLGAQKAQGELRVAQRSIVKAPIAEGGELDQHLDAFLQNSGLSQSNAAELGSMVHDAAAPPAEGEISIFRNGARERYRVDLDLARAMKGLDREGIGRFERLLSLPTKTLRAGAVLTPDFQLRHLIRDSLYAFLTYNRGGTFTPLDTARGVWGLIVKDQDFVNWLKGGGGQVSLVALDRNYLQENLERLTRDTGLMTRAWNVLRHPITHLEVLNELATSATHLGAFKKRMRQLEGQPAPAPYGEATPLPVTKESPRLGRMGLDKYRGQDLRLRDGVDTAEGMKSFGYQDGKFTELPHDTKAKRDIIDAAWTARETAVDASRIGAKMNAYNQISAFANIKIQDTDRVLRALKEDPASTLLKIGIGLVAPSVLLWAANHNDSRVQELPAWQKDGFWIIPTDRWQDATPTQASTRPADQIRIYNGQLQVNNGVIFRIPKPFNAGVLFASGAERVLDKYVAENPEAMKGYIHSVFEQTAGDVTPTGTVPILEQLSNRSFLSGHSLIPGNVENQLPEYQYTQYTSATAKALGRLIGSFPGMHSAALNQESPMLRGAADALSSPILIENYVRGWTGTLGAYVLKTLDASLRKAGIVPDEPHAPGSLADIPVIRAFVIRYPTATTQSIQDFYDEAANIKKLYATWQARAKAGDHEAMQRVETEGGQAMFAKVDSYVRALREQSLAIRRIDQDPKMTPEEKRQLIDTLYYGMIRIGQNGKALIKKLER